MSGKFEHLIPENCALPGAKTIGLYDKDNIRKGTIKVPSRMQYPNAQPNYSFLALADVHITYDTAPGDFERAMKYAQANCNFTCIAGDLTNTGANEDELRLYKQLIEQNCPSKPVYSITGNHEHYSTHSKDYFDKYALLPQNVVNIANLKDATGYPLYYSFERGSDLFIMVGHYGGYHGDGIGWLPQEMLSKEEFTWLYNTLEDNRNRRCFIFHHVLPHEHLTGSPNNSYDRATLWWVNDGALGECFIALLRHYKNTIFFHGHSHTRFHLQKEDKMANYSSKNGYRSVHIPSLAVPRDIVSGTLTEKYSESEAHIVDVFDDCIVLRGRDFADTKTDGAWLPIAAYKIDTTLVDVPEGTFVDPVGYLTT